MILLEFQIIMDEPLKKRMINLKKMTQARPFIEFKKKYDFAEQNNQQNIEAMCIASYSRSLNEVDSRFVNLKYIDNESLVFFSNYEGPKAEQFRSHDQVTVVFYWNIVNVQIRIKGKVNKISSLKSDHHFQERSNEKNALAISSRQSYKVNSYEEVHDSYNKVLNNSNLLKTRPPYWGGYEITPNYFEFWEGHSSRLNKRDVYEKSDDNWKHLILQP